MTKAYFSVEKNLLHLILLSEEYSTNSSLLYPPISPKVWRKSSFTQEKRMKVTLQRCRSTERLIIIHRFSSHILYHSGRGEYSQFPLLVNSVSMYSPTSWNLFLTSKSIGIQILWSFTDMHRIVKKKKKNLGCFTVKSQLSWNKKRLPYFSSYAISMYFLNFCLLSATLIQNKHCVLFGDFTV